MQSRTRTSGRCAPDGANPVAVWGNATSAPHCAFQAQPIPGTGKIVFTASAHHSITGGSLVIVDPSVGDNGHAAITRITPEIPFPEAESMDIREYYDAPRPLSEQFFLVAYSPTPLVWEPGANARNAEDLPAGHVREPRTDVSRSGYRLHESLSACSAARTTRDIEFPGRRRDGYGRDGADECLSRTVGCHESRLTTPANCLAMALLRPASTIDAGSYGGRPFSFMEVVQPLLREHCVRCHGPQKQDGNLDLSDTPRDGFTQSYWALCGAVRRSLRCSVEREDLRRLAAWIDCNAVFYGVYRPDEQARQLAVKSSPCRTFNEPVPTRTSVVWRTLVFEICAAPRRETCDVPRRC